MDMDFIRRRITELRLAKGVSEVTMSKALGHSNSYITHITSGRVNPSVPELLYMIEYLDVSPKTFFSEIEETESRSILLQKAIDKLERPECAKSLLTALFDYRAERKAVE